LEEEGSREARSLARSWATSGRIMATIDLTLPEAMNAIWKHSVKIGDLSREEAVRCIEDLLGIWGTLKTYSSREVAGEAFRLALEEDITVYDSLYIQLAKHIKTSLATFDKKLSSIVAKHGIATYP
jgi:predicted nucleic acid-binding protein